VSARAFVASLFPEACQISSHHLKAVGCSLSSRNADTRLCPPIRVRSHQFNTNTSCSGCRHLGTSHKRWLPLGQEGCIRLRVPLARPVHSPPRLRQQQRAAAHDGGQSRAYLHFYIRRNLR
jgi:hypothetical protein